MVLTICDLLCHLSLALHSPHKYSVGFGSKQAIAETCYVIETKTNFKAIRSMNKKQPIKQKFLYIPQVCWEDVTNVVHAESSAAVRIHLSLILHKSMMNRV